MYKIIRDGDLSNDTLALQSMLDLKIKIIRNLSSWETVDTSEEVHIIMQGNPMVDIDNHLERLHEGDIVKLSNNDHYRYFSDGDTIIFYFKN